MRRSAQTTARKGRRKVSSAGVGPLARSSGRPSTRLPPGGIGESGDRRSRRTRGRSRRSVMGPRQPFEGTDVPGGCGRSRDAQHEPAVGRAPSERRSVQWMRPAGRRDPVARWELHPLKKLSQTAPVPQLFSRPVERPIVSVSAWLALADWFRRYQRRQQGAHPCNAPCDEGSPPGRYSLRSGPECPTSLVNAASDPSDPTNPDLASPPAAVPPSPDRDGGRS